MRIEVVVENENGEKRGVLEDVNVIRCEKERGEDKGREDVNVVTLSAM